MRVRKEELYRIIDQLHDKDRKAIYDLAKYLISRPLILADEDGEQYEVAGDDDPLTDTEKEALKDADQHVEDGELVDWEDAKRELRL